MNGLERLLNWKTQLNIGEKHAEFLKIKTAEWKIQIIHRIVLIIIDTDILRSKITY